MDAILNNCPCWPVGNRQVDGKLAIYISKNQKNDMQSSFMKIFFLILISLSFSLLQAQETSFIISKQDTIELNRLHFARTVALSLDEATILLDYRTVLKKAQDERSWLKKRIRTKEKMIKKGKDYPGITSSQLKEDQQRLSSTDSIFKILSTQRSDTIWIDYSLILLAKSSISSLVSSSLENGRCMVLNADLQLQAHIVKQTGSRKTGEMTGVGLSYYFIKGVKRYFWSKMDWIS